MPFAMSFNPVTKYTTEDIWFIFRGDKLLVKPAVTGVDIPKSEDITRLNRNITGMHYYIGAFYGAKCFAAEIDGDAGDLKGMFFYELRQVLGLLDEDLFHVAGRAFQILHWERTHQFCGRCGSRTVPKDEERAKACPQCGLIIYPEIFPAIIVAVIRGQKILLAQSHRFRGVFYSVLAGFVEPGETFEETVRREVREEVAIEVKNIHYFGSQPWPFPNSLMVGFTADYDSGKIKIDESEIAEARWFSSNNLPPLPRKGTIARRLIDYFKERAKQQ